MRLFAALVIYEGLRSSGSVPIRHLPFVHTLYQLVVPREGALAVQKQGRSEVIFTDSIRRCSILRIFPSLTPAVGSYKVPENQVRGYWSAVFWLRLGAP